MHHSATNVNSNVWEYYVGKDMEHQHSQTSLVKIPTLKVNKYFLKLKEIAAHYRDISIGIVLRKEIIHKSTHLHDLSAWTFKNSQH